jgi:hypothetical protein
VTLQAGRLAAAQQAKRDGWDAAAAAGEPVDWWLRPVPAAEYCRVRQARARLDRAP